MAAARGKRGIAVPDETSVPRGPHRDFLVALHEVYAAAGRPGLRAIAHGVTADDRLPTTLTHHAIGRILSGSAIPSPRQVRALAAWLAEEAAAGAGGDDAIEQTVQRLADLCRAVGPAAQAPSAGAVSGSRSVPRPRHDVSAVPTAPDPGAVEAERLVLGAMLASNDAVADAVEALVADDFSAPAHRTLYTSLLGLYGSGTAITPGRAASALAGGPDGPAVPAAEALVAELGALASRSGPEQAADAMEVVQARAQLRRLVVAGRTAADLGTEALAGDPEQAGARLEAAEAAFHSVFRDRDRNALEWAAGPLERALDRAELVGVGGQAGVLTGFGDLDSLLGGLLPGHVVVVAGAPAMGKSTLALNLVRSAAVAQGVASLYICPDGDEEETLLRVFSAEARVPLHRIRGGTMTSEDWTRLARRMPDVAGAPLTVHDQADTTVAGVRRLCRSLQRGSGLGLVVVDPVQWIRPDAAPDGRGPDDLGAIVRELAVTAKEIRVPMVLVAQVPDSPVRRSDHPLGLGDLESGLVENADVVILLHREDAYEKLSPRAGEADLVVAKHRYGPTATITLAFQGHYARFVDMAPGT
ncbi:replicative DNA helicase [Streptomyces sp. NPDC001502]|uniref:replicative DNA helicase n=1 Tax=Streptomyces sp. NPDC001502 TaxID=3364578 RepID=UPI003694E7FE